MKGYLLDTNHIGFIFDGKRSVIAQLRSLPSRAEVCASVISLGEIEASFRITTSNDLQRRDEFERFVNNEMAPWVLRVDRFTRQFYGELVEGIWRRHQPRNAKVRTEYHLVTLGVDVNDLWIAAQAIEHNLILVTQDKMDTIREAAGKLLDIQNWAT